MKQPSLDTSQTLITIPHAIQTEMQHHAHTILTLLPSHGAVALWGDLGAGKTTLARHIIQLFCKDADLIVPSPTFTLIQTYTHEDKTLWHLDLYRLTDPEECHELGLFDALQQHLCMIEWPERMGNYLPKNRTDIHITLHDEISRTITVTTTNI